MIGLFMCVLAAALEGTANAEGKTDEAPPRHVEVKLVAAKDDPGLERVLTELLARLQVTSRFSSVAGIENEEMWKPHEGAAAAIARVWIDLRDPSQVTLYLTGDRQDRVLVRQVPLVLSLDEVAREEIAHIVEATVDELLLGGQIGVEKKRLLTTPPKADLPPPPPEPPVSLDIGLGYQTQLWKGTSLLHGPAAFAGLGKKTGRFRPGLWLSGELRFEKTIQVEGTTVSAQLDQGAIRLLVVVDRNLSDRWILRGGLGGGADLVNIGPSAAPFQPNVQLRDPRFIAVPMLRGLALVKYMFTAKSELFFALAADFDIFDTRYVVESQGTQSVFTPMRLRPTALFGVASDVLAY